MSTSSRSTVVLGLVRFLNSQEGLAMLGLFKINFKNFTSFLWMCLSSCLFPFCFPHCVTFCNWHEVRLFADVYYETLSNTGPSDISLFVHSHITWSSSSSSSSSYCHHFIISTSKRAVEGTFHLCACHHFFWGDADFQVIVKHYQTQGPWVLPLHAFLHPRIILCGKYVSPLILPPPGF